MRLDENVSSILWEAIQRFNEDAAYPLEATRVGDHSELPKGSDDGASLGGTARIYPGIARQEDPPGFSGISPRK
jgi:hypothetical protein